MWKFAAISFLTILVVWLWQVFCWVWLEPRRIERLLRKQGFKGNSYKLLFGDTKEIADVYKEAHSKPLGLHDDIVPRVMPFVVKTINTYGKNSFAWIGPRPRVYISDAEFMREVLTRHTNFQKNFRVTNKIYKLLVGGIVEFEEEKWTRHRMKLNPAFHLDRLKHMCPIVQSCCETILTDWKKKMKDGSGVVDVFHYLEAYTGSAVTTALFTHPFDADMRKCFHLLRDLSLMANIAVKTFDIPGKGYLPTAAHRKAKAMEAEVRDSFRTMINDRLKKRRAGIEDGRDLFDLFLDELYDEKSAKEVDIEGIVDDAIGNCKLFYFAGYETTSNLLVWTMVNLAIHQDWQTRGREEVYRILGKRTKLQPDDLSQLKIVNMIIHEVLRLFPPVFELSRVVEEDTKLGDTMIPKDILIQLPIAMLHRKPEIWGEDAHLFKPERFAEGVLKAANGQAAFMPFGWGPRICIGQNFAIMEAKIFLATLLQTFDWELSAEYTHAPYAAFTVQPQHGAPLVLRQIAQ
ncbi:cytochrome p450 cyp72a219 [Phtheirospermum japonicum]|uniref:Cytochrome p450 cyp72a219 n=1 Tax=Phtheirospermum japonicum TaxID=374723 RepID=A0A830BQF8_9LAMI|nr:cytochrome p450 cyp72a219 [Phtheirospermum japonicum]